MKLQIEMYGDQPYVGVKHLREASWYKKNSISGNEHFLTKSISQEGVKHPIVVNNFPGREGIIINGVEVVRVSRQLNIEEVPVFLLEVPEDREGLFHSIFNSSKSENSREQMIALMKADYLSFFEPDDPIVEPSSNPLHNALRAGNRSLEKNKHNAPKPIRKIYCVLPEEMLEFPEKAMKKSGCKSVSQLMIKLLKMYMEETFNA